MVEKLVQIPGEVYVLVGVMLAGIFSIWGVSLTNQAAYERLKLQLRHDRFLKKKERFKDRVEEGYILLERWLDVLFNVYAPILYGMTGMLSYNDALDMSTEYAKKTGNDFKRLEMLIDLYFPEAKEEFDRCLGKREEVIKIMNQFGEENEKGNFDGSRFSNSFKTAIVGLDEHGKRVKEIIIDLAKTKA